MRRLLLIPAAALLAALLAIAGCGSSDGASGLASLAQPGTVVFVEGTVRPSGELKRNTDRAAQKIGGIDNLGAFVIEKLEEEARGEGEPFDFESEVDPWLGDRGAFAFERVEADGDLSDPVMVLEATDTEAAQQFIDKQAETSDEPYRDASYEGVDYKFGGDDETAVGVVDDMVVVAQGEEDFKAAVDASGGDSLADEDRFDSAIGKASDGSLADVYVDLGTVLKQSGDEVDPEALSVLRQASPGFDPEEATLLASVIPGEDQVAVDVSGELGDEEAPSGDASELIGSLPAGSFAAFGVAGFGEELGEAIDSIDESGIPGQVPPGTLKDQLKAIGLDLEALAGSLTDAAVFAEGSSESSLGGALVMVTDDPGQARQTVAAIGSLLRKTGTPGVTAVSGEASGFSIRDREDLGDKPVVVVAKGDRIAIGYGLEQTMRGVLGGGNTLANAPSFQEAVAALGDTPLDAFVDGPAALGLADSLVPASEEGFQEAKRYLRGISSIAIGSGSGGDGATAKLIVSLR